MEPEKADVDADVAKVCDFYSVNDGRLLSVVWKDDFGKFDRTGRKEVE